MLQIKHRAYAPGPIEFKPLAASKHIARDVAQALRHGIVTMGIPPGTMLSEQDVGRQLGVSRQPVREAFIKLSEARLLVVRPQRGTQVVRISRIAVDEALFIRAAVECALARAAAQQIDAHAIARLAANLERQRCAAASLSFDGLFALDEEFHRMLALAAGRPAAWMVIDSVKPHLDRVRWLSMDLLRPLDRVVDQHEAIFEALQARDGAQAARLMQVHVGDFTHCLTPIAARHPDLFDEAPAEPCEILAGAR
jgi:DNA-binding GntR family transcriptional regulator